MKKTLLGLLATAMLITACQKEAAAPTNEATLVPKCLEGEFIAFDEYQRYSFIKVTNANIGSTWTPKYGSWRNRNGETFKDSGVTFNNVVMLINGLRFPDIAIPSVGYIDRGTKVYFTIDSTKLLTQDCYNRVAAVTAFNYSPTPSISFCAKSFSTTKCK